MLKIITLKVIKGHRKRFIELKYLMRKMKLKRAQ